MAVKKYKVVKDHIGDKEYFERDIREADEHVVAHLIPNVLVEIDPPAPVDPAPPAPENKKGKPAQEVK